MTDTIKQRILAMALVVFAVAVPLRAQDSALPAAPDSTLYTTYTAFSGSGQTTVNWVVCGSTQQTEGCYDSGSIGPFVGIGAMMEGIAFVNGNIVTRAIYVVDSGATSSVKLYFYKKVDTVTADFDTTTVTLVRTVKLPLTGGATAQCFMAANSGFLFIGTDQSPQAVEVRKSNLSVTQLGGFSPPINVSAITADQYGYVTVTQGNSSGSGFSVFGPSGGGQEDGGGADFMLGTMQGVSPAALLLAPNTQLAPRRGYQFKSVQP